ncbi:hypothetical protein COEREDRAFT_7344 [Coemansia reversa NRRL 1564]|uniref:HMG box domain-containing protein n=1 Tax=Coemansia reversa (strain ATCC 12441 / NRRL 1564) TaxID=763665 RepID=A0A2G5BFJ1_COERN|nr:hypothetical protein COEREDRAFT_7344 [Coemansia reversa NRRL 1564]|eukprot:PIA17761.1 hypothetical protein COEREDRAFT_7344 [Coemansia reversa NRRL 1564]
MEGYYSNSYPRYNSVPHPHGQPFMQPGYSGVSGVPAASSGPGLQMHYPSSPYSFMPHPASKQSPPYHPRSQQNYQQHHQPPTTSSRVVTEPSCTVYRSSQNGDQVTHTARQIIAADGKIFIEHIPGHNVIFAPVKAPISLTMHRHSPTPRIVKPRIRAAPVLSRPSNVFFKYRSVKQRELQEKHPRLNQTVISRMVAEHWKREPEELKRIYKDEYKEEMKKYELSKKLRKSRPNYEYIESDEITTHSDSNAAYFQSDIDGSSSFVQEPHSISSPHTDHVQRHRSFTMPNGERQQLEISQLIH